MSRVVALGAASQDVYLLDRDDFESVEVDGQSIFGKMEIGTKVDIDQAFFSIGGSGANAAVSFARHGHEAIYIGNLAQDVAGEAVVRCFDDENVDSSYVEFVPGATACSVILLDAKTCQSTVLSYRGVSRKSRNLKATDLQLIQPDWLYAGSLNGDMETLLEFFEEAHRLGAKVMFNPGPKELAQSAKLIGLLEDADILLVNKFEASQIVPGVILVELIARLRNYCQTVLITDGAMGAIATNGHETYRVGIYEQAKVRDVVGAGDAFGSGFLAEYAESGNFKKSLCFAAANATMVMKNYGAQQGILTGDEKLHPMPIMQVEDLNGWLQEPRKEEDA